MIREFAELDPRKDREKARITSDNLIKRYNAITETIGLKNKSILDLGCANAAFGYLSMVSECASYHGIEIREYYYNTARYLLNKYCHGFDYTLTKKDIVSYLSTEDIKYDVVYACGILYGVFDVLNLLKSLFTIANETVVIESLSLKTQHHKPVFEVVNMNMINADNYFNPILGVSLMPNFLALNEIAAIYGFEGKQIFLNNSNNYIQEYSSPTSHRYIGIFNRIGKCKKTLEMAILEK